MKRLLHIVPECRPGAGGGHLHRALRLVRDLRQREGVVSLLLPADCDPDRRSFVAAGSGASGETGAGAHRAAEAEQAEQSVSADASGAMLLIDRPWVTRAEIEGYAAQGLIVGLDVGGSGREYCDYLIDTLPRLGRSVSPANRSERGLLQLPQRRRTNPSGHLERILLAFGAEDRVGLTATMAAALLDWGLCRPQALSVLRGPFMRLPGWLEQAGIELLDAPLNIAEQLADWDLVIGSFGLTAYEAAWAGAAVLLLNPTRYHSRLARRAGFVEIGLCRPRRGRLRQAFSDPQRLIGQSAAVVAPIERSRADRVGPLSVFLEQLLDRAPQERPACPICGLRPNPALERFRDYTYFRCRDCSLIYMGRFAAGKPSYDDSYFFERYRAQYGHDYLEDFEHIRALGRARLGRVMPLLASPARGRRLLDIGCAYGAFLVAAADAGFKPIGVDVNAAAIEYVRRHLGLVALLGPAEELEPEQLFDGGGVDVVSLWYVIEHSADVGALLRRIHRLLRPGGVLVFSTPNGSGISARRNRRAFLDCSPDDHYTIWEPHRTAALLRRFGFRLQKLHITGHHPERFGRWAKRVPILHPPIGLCSRLLRLGDTYEAYATKEQYPA